VRESGDLRLTIDDEVGLSGHECVGKASKEPELELQGPEYG
jgi:hypothetical protein